MKVTEAARYALSHLEQAVDGLDGGVGYAGFEVGKNALKVIFESSGKFAEGSFSAMDANVLFSKALGLGSGWKVVKSEMDVGGRGQVNMIVYSYTLVVDLPAPGQDACPVKHLPASKEPCAR